MTKRDLHELYWTKKNVQHMQEKVEELETQATKMTTYLSSQPKGTSVEQDKMADIVSKIVELQNEMNYELKRAYEFEIAIEKAIETLPAREAYLIRLRYVKLLSWERICVEMNYQWAQVHRIHADALKQLA